MLTRTSLSALSFKEVFGLGVMYCSSFVLFDNHYLIIDYLCLNIQYDK